MNIEQFEKKQFSGRVISRMLSRNEKNINEWFDDYRNNYKGDRGVPEITSQFKKMAEEYFRGMKVFRLMKEYGVLNTSKFWKIIAYVERQKNTNKK